MQTFTSDHHFRIGEAHLSAGKPCQDYATSESYADGAYAVVADGCSSGGETDVGARVLALATAAAIREQADTSAPADCRAFTTCVKWRQRATLASVRASLRLSIDDLLATCLYAYAGAHGGYLHVEGDGVVVLKWRTTGTLVLKRYRWENNTPFYPAYVPERLTSFWDAHGGNLLAYVLTEERRVFDAAGNLTVEETRPLTLAEGMVGITTQLSPTKMEDIEFIAVFSDGVEQVEGMSWDEVAASLLRFRSPTGAFAKRRMIRAVKDMRKAGKGPIDDIAYAVVRVDETRQSSEEYLDDDYHEADGGCA